MDVNRVVEIAHGELGYRETGNNHQKYSPAVPGLEWSQNQPWCATFTCWVFLQAGGKPNEDFPLTASCLQQVAWGVAVDVSTPLPRWAIWPCTVPMAGRTLRS